MSPATRYVISCAARTGSTMLVHLLRSHPDILAHGEVFSVGQIGMLVGRWPKIRRADPSVSERLWRWRVEDAAGFLNDVVFDPQGRAAVGFKFKTDEAFDDRWADIQSLVASDDSIVVIHLRRRDLLAQYVSHQVVLHQAVPTLRKSGKVTITPFRIDIDDALRYAADVRARDERAEQLYISHRSMSVEYEAIDTDGLCRFLGVPVAVLTTPTQKIIEDRDRIVLNLDAAVTAFRRYGFGTA